MDMKTLVKVEIAVLTLAVSGALLANAATHRAAAPTKPVAQASAAVPVVVLEPTVIVGHADPQLAAKAAAHANPGWM
jgi:hypothetical protein